MTARASRRRHLALAVLAVAAVTLPFLSVRLLPVADLPQQVAQIRLLEEALADPAGPYRVEWWGPNRLSYLLLGAAWAIFGPDDAGRVALLAIGLLWVAAAFTAARRRGRPPEAAVLASVLFFNHTTYWGLYSFSLGLPLFVLFVDVADRVPDRPRPWDGARLFAWVLLLFLAHVFWLAAGAAWLGASAALSREPRAALARLAPAAPALGWALWWNRRLEGSALDSPSVWHDVARWRPAWLVDATLGGLRGHADEALAAFLLAWLVAAAVRAAAARRRGAGAAERPPDAGDRWDRALLLAAALLAAAALVLPDGTHGTIRVAARWMPMAAVLALLAAPAPSRRRAAAGALACAVALAFSGRTAAAWRAVEQEELSGLAESVAALPARPRVLGLDLVKESAHVRGRPFLQGSAYAQVARGGGLAFTFAVFPSSLVLRRTSPPEPWTKNLPWSAERATRADAEHFDHVLVNAAGDAAHERAAESLGLTPVTREGRWRLYRVAPLAAGHARSPSMSSGSAGFETCRSKPASSAARRSSGRP